MRCPGLLVSSLLLWLGCSGSPGPGSSEAPRPDEPERSLEQWIAALEQTRSARRAAVELRAFAARPDSDKAIEPLLRAWERDQHMPDALATAIVLAADGGGGPHWPRVVPTLRLAVSDATASDARSLESALLAVSALARARDDASVPTLIAVARRSVPDLAPAHRLRLAAIAALGQFGTSRDAVAALVDLLRVEPSHRVQVIPSAAALALGQTRDPAAVVPLLEAVLRMPSLFPAARRALVTIGQPAVPELVKLLQARHETLGAVARALELDRDCDREMGLGTSCPAPGLLRYRAAVLLGDFRARAAVQPLVDALARPPVPVFFDRAGPGPDDHVAVLEALAALGDPAAAPAIWTYARDPARKPENRAAAVDAYSTLVSDPAALPVLAGMWADTGVAPALRRAAARGHARMVREPAALEPLRQLLARPLPETGADTRGPLAGRTAPADLARGHAGAQCAADADCYARLLQHDTDKLLAPLIRDIPDLARWPEDARLALSRAVKERALLELAKLGPAARPVLPKLFHGAATHTRALRKRALETMARIAELPCDECVTRLGSIIDAERDDDTRSWMLVETEIARDYFTWAGR